MGFRGRGRGNFRGKGSRGNYNNNNYNNGHVPNYNLNDPYNNPNNYDNYGNYIGPHLNQQSNNGNFNNNYNNGNGQFQNFPESTPRRPHNNNNRKRMRPEFSPTTANGQSNSTSNSTTSATVTGTRSAKIPCECMIGSFTKYLPDVESMNLYKKEAIRQPKKLLFIPSNTNVFNSNKIDVAKYTVRGITYVPEESWYVTSDNEKYLDDDENLGGVDADKHKNMLKFFNSIEKDLTKISTLYAPTNKFLIINGSRTFTAACKYTCAVLDWVCIDLNPLNKISFNNVESKDQLQVFIKRCAHYIKYFHSENPTIPPTISPDAVFDPDAE